MKALSRSCLIASIPPRPLEEQIQLYYFTFAETVSLLKCTETDLRQLLGRGRYGEIKRHGHWMIPPDQVWRLRDNLSRDFNEPKKPGIPWRA